MKKESGVRSQNPEAPPLAVTGGADMAQSDMSANRLAPIGPNSMGAPPSETAGDRTTPSAGQRTPLLEEERNEAPAAPLLGKEGKQGRSAGSPKRRDICTDVTKLEPEWRELVEKLIEEGSTVEDVVEILKEREGPRVTLHALEVHYQSNLDLQKRRIKHLIELGEKLKNAMAHPESTEARLADATLFTGLVRLTRRQAQLAIKDAQSLRLQRGNLRLRQRILKMKQAQAVREKSIAHQRYLFEEARRHKLTLQNEQLEEILKKLRQDQTLPADVMGKIQEIYGIVKEPYIPPKLAEQLRQPETL